MEPSEKIENLPHRTKYRWAEDFKDNRSAVELKAAIEKILAAHRLLGCFQEGARFLARIESSSALPLTIIKQDRHLTVAHYFLQDGDTNVDPAMDLEIGKDGAWYPVSVELADGNCRQCTVGPLKIDFEERRKQAAFAARWAADLLVQGYEQGEVSQLWGEND